MLTALVPASIHGRLLPALLLLGALSPETFTALAQPSMTQYVVRLDRGLAEAVVTAQLPAGTRRVRVDSGQAQHLPRDFATFMTIESATAYGRPLEVGADPDAGWTIEAAGDAAITLRYRVDLSFAARPWPAGNEQAAAVFDEALYVVGRSLFLLPDPPGAARVRFDIPPGWRVSTPWTPVPGDPANFETGGGFDLTRNALAIGRHPSVRLTAGPIDLELALPGATADTRALVEPVLRRVLPAYLRLFPETRPGRYLMTFFTAHADDGESFLQSATFTSQDALTPESTIVWGNFLAHELFHYWNGQRIRGAEARTQWRWVAEGFTEYYANVTLAREQVITPDLFLKKAERHLGNYLYFMTSPALQRRSLVDAGVNTTANRFGVYDGGWTAAFCLDGLIRERSGNTRSLDDFMRALWQRFGRQGAGYSLADLDRLADEVAGQPLDGFLHAHAAQIRVMPVPACADRAGLQIATKGYAAEAFLFPAPSASPAQLERRRGIYGPAAR